MRELNSKGTFWGRLPIFLLSTQGFVFVLYLLSHMMAVETPILPLDENFYLAQAHELWRNISGPVFLHPGRPIFSWISVILLSLLKLQFNRALVVLLNTAFYSAILVLSLRSLFSELQVSRLGRCFAFSLILAMPLFFDASTSLMGDLAVSAWSFLFLMTLLRLNKNPSFPNVLLMAFVFALGFQTKPVFAVFGGTLLGAFALAFFLRTIVLPRFTKKKPSPIQVKTIFFKWVAAILVLVSTAYFTFPRDFFTLLHELYYNSTVNRYDVSEHSFDLYFRGLWLLQVLGENLPVFGFVTLIGLGFLRFIVALGSARDRRASDFKATFSHAITSSVAIVGYAFLVLYVFFGFFVGYKDGRETFFIIPLAVSLCLSGTQIRKSSRLAKVEGPLIWVGLVTNCLATFCWSPAIISKKLDLFNRHFDLRHHSIADPLRPDLRRLRTLNSLGVIDVLIAVDEEAKKSNYLGYTHVFMPHESAEYNAAIVGGAAIFASDRFGVIAGITHRISSKIILSYGTYKYGSFNEFGGIPSHFLNGEFVLLPKNMEGTIFPHNPDLDTYNQMISKNLAEKNPTYLDGLVEIYRMTNAFNREFVLYKRLHPPSAQNFVKIVSELVKADRLNMWNVPYMNAALMIDPTLSEIRHQLRTMAKPEFLKSVTYTYAAYRDELQMKTIRDILAENPIAADLSYPQLFSYFKSN